MPSPDSSEISNAESDTDYSESDDEPDARPPAPEPPTMEQVKRGLLSSDISDGIERGCGCKSKNHWKVIPEQQLEDYIFEVSKLRESKKSFKQFVLGALTGSMRKSMTGGDDRPFYFSYHERGYELCKDVFMAVHAVLEVM